MDAPKPTYEALEAQLAELRYQLGEAQDTLEAIRTGQVDALMVESEGGHQLYALKTADLNYRVFIENMSEGAVTLNTEGVVLYSNAQFAALLGLPLHAVMGSRFSEWVAPSEVAKFDKLMADCPHGDRKEELSLLNGDATVPVLLSASALSREGLPTVSIIVTDLTDQKAAQEELLEKARRLAETNHALELSNHDLQQFASVASHDLQEPLRKIQMFANLLEDRHGESLAPGAKEYLQKITASARRMKGLILDVLDYSKLSAGDGGAAEVDLRELIYELLLDFELLIEDVGATVQVGALPTIRGNRGQLRQVFQNLISNALKFSRPGVPVEVSVDAEYKSAFGFDSAPAADGNWVCISVRDNGIGFDEQYLDKIFSLFERLHPTSAYEGTGIGLAITKKIVDKHGGLVTARSKPGEGAEFLILLKRKEETEI